MTALTSRAGAIRWAVPAIVVAAVAVVASGLFSANATAPLPPRTAAQLLVDLQSAGVDGLSGTIVQDARLGIPQLPDTGPQVGGQSVVGLLAGSHTLKVWYAGSGKQRLALLDTLGETDVIHNGADVWYWTSENSSATHYRVPAHSSAPEQFPVPMPLTPQQAADAALAALNPTTAVSTNGTSDVAGRSAYELVLSPRDNRSLIGQVRLAIDAATHVPLRVQVYGRDTGSGPAFEVGYTRVSFAVPGDEQFTFTPPPGTVVKQGSLPSMSSGSAADHPALPGSESPRSARHRQAPATGSADATAGRGGAAPGGGTGRGARLPPPAFRVGEPAPAGRRRPHRRPAYHPGPDRRRAGPGRPDRCGPQALPGVLDDGRPAVGAVTPDLLYAAVGQR